MAEIVGLVAGVAQISLYALNIASTIRDIRLAFQNGPILLRERDQQLEVLSLIVTEIEANPRLHSKQIAGFLVTVHEKILRLHHIIRHRLLRPTDSSLRRLRAALTCVGLNKEVEESFTALHRDCQTLDLYMSYPRESDREVVKEVERPQPPAHDTGRFSVPITESTYEMVAQVAFRQSGGPMPGPSTGESRSQPAAEVPRIMHGQSFKNISSEGKDAKISAGNHTAEVFRLGFPQTFQDLSAKDNSQHELGNTIFERESEKPTAAEKDAKDGRT